MFRSRPDRPAAPPDRWAIRRDALHLTRQNAVAQKVRLVYAGEYTAQARVVAAWLEQAPDLPDYQARIAAIQQVIANGGKTEYGPSYNKFGPALVREAANFYEFFVEDPQPATT